MTNTSKSGAHRPENVGTRPLQLGTPRTRHNGGDVPATAGGGLIRAAAWRQAAADARRDAHAASRRRDLDASLARTQNGQG